MIYTSRPPVEKFVKFLGTEGIQISSHRVQNGVTHFTYDFILMVNISKIRDLNGELQGRVTFEKKRERAISVKASRVTTGNMIKAIDRQRLTQIAGRKNNQRFAVTKYIDRPDLVSKMIKYQIEIPSAGIGSAFTIEIANIQTDGFVSVIDSIDVDHASILGRYDIPTDEFYFTAVSQGNRKIYATATTEDPNTGYFKFSLKNNSNPGFSYRPFAQPIQVSVDERGMASAVFNVPDANQKYTVRAHPVSRIKKQEIGNVKEAECSVEVSDKIIPFYLTSLSDSAVSFTIASVDDSVSRVMLYRQGSSDISRELVTFSDLESRKFILEDSARKPQYDYTYSVDYVGSDGVLKSSAGEVIVPRLKLDKLARINASLSTSTTGSALDQSIQGSILNFNVEIAYDTNTLYDEIVSDLKQLGLESILSNDIEKMTNNLKPITRVLISRISKITGEETMVGVYQPGEISIKNQDKDPCIFRFEVAVRSAPEALEMMTAGQSVISDNSYNLKSSVDLASKLIGSRSKVSNTSFSSKFFTRDSIRDSTLRFGNASSLYDLSYYAGRTGVFTDIEIIGKKKTQNSVKNITTTRNQKGTYLRWDVVGNIDQIDYFEIEIDGRKHKCSPISSQSQCFFIGKTRTQNIKITPYVSGIRNDAGSAKLGR
jgi:hypothetical protein